jgi:cytoskeletal protein RodZ
VNNDNKKSGTELDRKIERLGLEAVDDKMPSEDTEHDLEGMIDLKVVNEEIKKKKSKKKGSKKLNISIISGGALIIILVIVILILKGCSGNAQGAQAGETTVFDGQGTTAGDIDRPDNVTQPVITTTTAEPETESTTEEATTEEESTTEEATTEEESTTEEATTEEESPPSDPLNP